MNKYYPVLFIRFSGTSLFKKIAVLISLLTIFISFNSASAQWTQQTRPNPPNPNLPIEDIFFIDTQTGWAIGNNDLNLKTTNGGVNWINRSTSSLHHMYAVYFLNANTGFAAGMGTTFGRVIRTTNGGTNWTALTGFDSGIWRDIFFINSQTGWVAGSGGVSKTTDGGNNWSVVTSLSLSIRSIFFANENTGWVCGTNTSSTHIVSKTTNGGLNWSNASTLPTSPFTISFSDANNGRVSGQDGYFSTTTNGGTNWTTKTPASDTLLHDHSFINPSTGWVVGKNIYFTSNGGTSWIEQESTSELRAIFSLSTSTKFAGGVNIYKTETGGFDLQTPGDFTLTPVSSSQINLSWIDNSSEEERFMIERRAGGGGWQLIDSVNPGVTSYQSSGLTSNTEYGFRVYGKKGIFTSVYAEASTFTLMETPVNQYPANNAVIPADTTTLRWNQVPGTTIQCTIQVATDLSFSNIIYQTVPFGANITSVLIPAETLQNSTSYFWRVKVSNFGTYSEFSTPTKFTYQNSNYGNNMSSGELLYYFANSTPGADLSPSKPTYNWRDTTGSTNLILNTVSLTPLGAGNTDDGRFDLLNILPAGNSIKFFGTNYQNIYVGTNGIVGFIPFTPNGAGNYEPMTGFPQANITNAIFPFWKDLNFSDVDVPVNRLCFKVTSEELIITYMRAPNYNPAFEVNDYVSFQVIIKHSSLPAANSKIEVMYNYDQTGSTFRTKYNANNLSSNLIGLQASNILTQSLQYRYLNSLQQLISPGPMFGSNLALAMGPDHNTLPVELASFTSSVNANNVYLNWSTASEENNSGFDVEKMSIVNGELSMWSKVGSVQGSGTTNETKNYSYEDKNIPSGNYKYRLKQIDFNGNFEYHELSNEVIVGVPNKFALSQNYPNPFNPATKINFEIPKSANGELSMVKLHVYDVTGRMITELVNKQMDAGYYTIDFNGANFASGIYFYRLVTNDFVQTKKMLLVK